MHEINLVNIAPLIIEQKKMIKTTIIYLLTATLFFVSCTSNSGKYDDRAIESLDNLSETIGNLNSCSYTLATIVSKENTSEFSNEHDVYMRGPDKMYIHTNGTKGEKGFWYDGSNFAYFSYNKNTYDTISAPGNIIAAIDQLHHKFGIDFPAADFFYPSFTDDIINNFSEVLYMGDNNIDGVDCIHIEAVNKAEILQIWIEKETNLPHKMIIGQINNSGSNYEAVFSNWRVNPNLPDILFEFEPPTNSTRKKLQPKN